MNRQCCKIIDIDGLNLYSDYLIKVCYKCIDRDETQYDYRST